MAFCTAFRAESGSDGLPRGERNGTLTEIFASKANTVAAAPLREYVYGPGLGVSTSSSVCAAPPRRTHPARFGAAAASVQDNEQCVDLDS